MKNLINNVKSHINHGFVRMQLADHTLRQKLRETEGNFVMDHAIVFVIIVVLGGAAIALLTNYLNDDLSHTLKDKINDFFN